MTEHEAAPLSPTRGHKERGAANEIYHHRGLQVPWVTRWTSEVRDAPFRVIPGEGIRYADETPEDRQLGVLWLRQGVSPGLGEPQWKQVHTYRQRDAMTGPCCQVCGRLIEGRVTWLTPAWALKLETQRGRIKTSTPPTCEDCIETARRLCPHLHTHESVVLDVRGYRQWAAFGDIAVPGAHGQGEIPLLDDRIKYVLGRQMVVEIYDFRKRRA